MRIKQHRRIVLAILCGLLASLFGGDSFPAEWTVDEIRIEGDVAVVESLPLWEAWSSGVTGREVSSLELEELRGELLSALQSAGYLFAQVELVPDALADGVLVAKVSCGTLGEFSIRRHGRHYTARQIIAKLSGRGQTFNYVEFCRRLAKANSDDLRIDVTLRPVYREQGVAVDVEVEYEDSLPLHGSLTLTNATAKEAKSPIQVQNSLQLLNVLRCDDVFSLHYVTNGDVGGEVNAVYGSWQFPMGESWTLTTFGSWSDSAYEDVLPTLDVLGRGYSYGLQLEREIHQDEQRRLALAAGWRVACTRNRLRLDSEMLELDSARVSMPFLNLTYSDLRLDGRNGRDYASLGVSGSRAGAWGASEKQAFVAEGRGADGTFWQTRLTAARLQRLFTGEDHPGRWTLFMRVHALYSSEAAPNACREFIGGFETIRGYREAEVSGDTLFVGSLELRTPLLGDVSSSTSRFRLHGILFTDFGWVANHDDNLPENGRPRHRDLVSVGLGLRMGVGKAMQVALDYALPLNRHATSDTPATGRWHCFLQLQF